MRSVMVALVATALGLGVASCAPKKDKAGPPPVPTVTTAQPLVRPVVDWDDFVGHFEAVDSVEVRPRVSGYLVSVGFRDGQPVQRGQTLFTIDPRPYRAALDQAQAQSARARATLANARVERARAQTLFAGRAASQQELEARNTAESQAVADLASAEANVRTAQLNLSFTRVVAPMSGRASDRRVSPGALVAADQTVLTTLVTVDPIRFIFTGSESAYLKYQREDAAGSRTSSRLKANPVEIRIQGEDAYRFKGRMDFVDNAVDPSSGTIRGRALVPNPGGFLTPGLFGHLRLLGSGAYDAVLVPDSAIGADQSRQVVYVVGSDGKVAAKVVQPGQLIGGLRAIRQGLAPSDRVIIDGLGAAKPGAKVQVKPGRIVPDAVGGDASGGPAPAAAG